MSFDKFRITYGHKFDEHQNSIFLQNHEIMKKLDRGYESEFNMLLNLPDVKEKITTSTAVAL